MWNCISQGDAGDTIFQSSIIQELTGGPHNLLIQKNTVTTLRSDEAIQKFIRVMKPLMEVQPYIKDFRVWESGDAIDWDGGGFRALGLHYTGISLLECHAQHLAITHGGIGRNLRGTRQWLHVEPSMETRGMVVVNRTSRYNNTFFPWKQVVEHYKGRILFIGLKHEHEAFCSQYGKVSWRQTSDMLEMARLIAGSQLFIGNQSSANALCEGLKANLIQETALHIPDCIFRRANAQHVGDGGCILPDVSGSGVRETESVRKKDNYVFRTHRTPPDGWQYGKLRHTAWNSMVIEAKRLPEFRDKSEEDVATVIMQANQKRKPDFFQDNSFAHLFGVFLKAYQTASVA